jgi:cytochrome c-type biogenesis protein CcmH/NrfG
MNEDEEYDKLQAEIDELAAVTMGGYSPHKLARMQTSSVLLLYKSNNRLATPSERLAKVNIRLTVAVLILAVLQLVMIAVQIWLTMEGLQTI